MNFSTDDNKLQGASLLDKAPFSSLLFHIENEAHEAILEEQKNINLSTSFCFGNNKILEGMMRR
ncbi:hypothetical protein ACLMAB_27975 [Brevibacillus laterosporus]